MYKELLLGCGNRREKDVKRVEGETWQNLVTIDMDPLCKPDIVWDLEKRPLPFKDEEFDEIHAYEVLEHIGTQGDVKKFFEEFGEYWRILKEGGLLIGNCPRHDDIWAWADPGHRRIITKGTLSYLSQNFYEQIGITTCSDYRFLWDKNFDFESYSENGNRIYFIMKKNGKRKSGN